MSAKVTIVRNPFNVKEDKVFKVRNNTCVKNIKGFDPNNSVVYVNGRHVESDYCLKKGDYCVIRQYPSAGITLSGIFTGLMITAGVLAVAEGISFLVSGRGLFTNIGIGLRKWLMGDTDSASNTPDQVTQLPSVSGSKNQSAFGRAVPLILGRTYFAPYVLGLPYNTIGGADGENDYYHALYLVGYNNVKVSDICMGAVDEISPNAQGVENGAITDISPRFANNEVQLEIRGTGDVSLYPCKVVQENYNEQLRNVEGNSTPFYAFSARYPKKVELELSLQGLLGYDKNGNKKDAEARVIVEYSLDGGITWQNCSNLIDFSQATGSSRYVGSQGSVTVTLNYKNMLMMSNFDMSLSAPHNEPVYLQKKFGNAWLTTLEIPAGQISASKERDTVPTGEIRIVSGSYTSTVYKMSVGEHTITDSIPVGGFAGHILFKNQKNQTMRYVLRQTFTWAQMQSCPDKVVQYKVSRITAETTESTIIDKVYLTAIRTWCYDKSLSSQSAGLVDQIPMNAKERDKTTRIGMSVKVTGDLNLDKINLIATSKGRTFDGTGWSKTLTTTRNPASLALMLMTGDFRDPIYRYNLTESGDYVVSDKIDLQDFGRLYQECEELKDFGNGITDKRYYCDGVVLNGTKTIDVINNVLNCARSNLIIKGKKYGIFTDKEQEYPLLVLNNNNLLSISYSKSFEEIPDGQSVKYVSALNYYQQDTIVIKPVIDDQGHSAPVTATDKIETVEYPFISDPYHAKAMSLYQQACKKLRPEIMNAKVTGEGGLAEVGSLISLQTDKVLIGIGDGAEITELVLSGNSITGIKTDGRFIVTDIGEDYGVVINVVDSLGNEKVLKKKLSISRTGTFSELTFETPISFNDDPKPEEGCIVSFGLYENETLEVLCIGKEESGDGTYGLTLVPYSPEVFEADSHFVHDFDSKTTPPSKSGMPIHFGDISVPVTQQELGEATAELRQEIAYGDETPPDAPTNLTAVAEEIGIQLKWTPVEENGLNNTIKHYVIEKSTDSGENWTALGTTFNSDFMYVFNRGTDKYPEADYDHQSGRVEGEVYLCDYRFRIKAVNIYGYESAYVYPNINIDVSSYGTWKIPPLSIIKEVVDRTVILTAVYTGTVPKVYGLNQLKVWIKRNGNTDAEGGQSFNQILHVTPDDTWYTPEFNESVMGSESVNTEKNYHKFENGTALTDPYITNSYKISHTLPLMGQCPRLYNGTDYVGITGDAVVVPSITEVEEVPASPVENQIILYNGETDEHFTEGKWYIYQNSWTELSDGFFIKYNGIATEDYKNCSYYVLDSDWAELTKKNPTMVTTEYIYKMTMFNESCEVYPQNAREASDTYVQALCTNIADIVHSHEHYKNLYVEKLSAINANLGMISQGGMGSFESMMNCWALSDLSPEDSGVPEGVMRGTFRVGDENEYFRVTPYNDPSSTSGRKYKIELKAGNIELSTDVGGETSSMDFTNGTYVYNADKSARMMLSPNGITAQTKTYSEITPVGTENPKVLNWYEQIDNTYVLTNDTAVDSQKTYYRMSWSDISKVYADEKGNMIISNADKDKIPAFGYQVDASDTIYHFDDYQFPENEEVGEGETPSNPEAITYTGKVIGKNVKTPPLLDSDTLFSGTITKQLGGNSPFVGNIVFFSKADKVVTSGKGIVVSDSPTKSVSVETAIPLLIGYNDAMKETSTIDPSMTVGAYLGLNQSQVENGIF